MWQVAPSSLRVALQDILPGVLNQLGKKSQRTFWVFSENVLGPENLASLKKMAEQYSQDSK